MVKKLFVIIFVLFLVFGCSGITGEDKKTETKKTAAVNTTTDKPPVQQQTPSSAKSSKTPVCDSFALDITAIANDICKSDFHLIDSSDSRLTDFTGRIDACGYTISDSKDNALRIKIAKKSSAAEAETIYKDDRKLFREDGVLKELEVFSIENGEGIVYSFPTSEFYSQTTAREIDAYKNSYMLYIIQPQYTDCHDQDDTNDEKLKELAKRLLAEVG